MKTIEIDRIDTKPGFQDEPWQSCVPVAGFPDFDEVSGVDRTDSYTTLVAPNELVTELEELRIEFDYPLTNSVTITAKQAGGFTRYQLYSAIYYGYKYIYDTENNVAGDPGLAPGMYNRMPSNGPFGIWGHVMEDLVIEAVHIHDDGRVELGIGS